MSAPNPNLSESTAALLDHLQEFPRRVLSSLLARQADPESFLVSGAARRQLKRLPLPQIAHKSFCPSAWATVGFFDPAFPAALRNIPDPPLVLFYRGKLNLLDGDTIAIVGARRCTQSGKVIARQMACELSLAGVHVISGLAYGIDAAAHTGVLSAADGVGTVAVLGGGLNRVYPRRHGPLLDKLLHANGLVLTEYPDDVSPRPYHFPERNRLISGLCRAVVVVEATLHSGSLITAQFAGEQGRDVMAVPGPVASETSKGCHALIKDGAALVTCANDVLENLALETVRPSPTPADVDQPVGEEAQKVYANIRGEPVSLDELIVHTQLSPAALSQTLVALELAGFVQQGPFGYIRGSFY